jgi:hypothetical protein
MCHHCQTALIIHRSRSSYDGINHHHIAASELPPVSKNSNTSNAMKKAQLCSCTPLTVEVNIHSAESNGAAMLYQTNIESWMWMSVSYLRIGIILQEWIARREIQLSIHGSHREIDRAFKKHTRLLQLVLVVLQLSSICLQGRKLIRSSLALKN